MTEEKETLSQGLKMFIRAYKELRKDEDRPGKVKYAEDIAKWNGMNEDEKAIWVVVHLLSVPWCRPRLWSSLWRILWLFMSRK